MTPELARFAAEYFDFDATERLLMTLPLADVAAALVDDERPTLPPGAP